MAVDSHRRILVVDDDAPTRKLLATVLKQRGMLVDEADDGDTAIDLAGANHYAVVLLDLVMPKADGFEVIRSLRYAEPRQRPIVLVITGADHHTTDQLDARNIHGIIRKPFDADDVASVVSACVEIRSGGIFGPMAIAMLSGAPLFAWLSATKL
jgi:DNA-binding response OmpR family regulator